MKLIIIILVYLNITNIHSKSYFCGITCGGKLKHSTCEREPCPLAPKCGTEWFYYPMNDTVRNIVVEVHNEFRNRLATGEGKESLAANGPASNMRAISYDKEQEFVIKCWVKTCKMGHDKCRGTSVHKISGQNLWSMSSTGRIGKDFGSKGHIKHIIKAFYDEGKLAPADVIDHFGGNIKAFGHFTQLVWAGTYLVGCAGISHKEGKKYHAYFGCNYGPSGNMQKGAVFKRGEACSACPKGTKCNSKYKGLCGDIRPLEKDKWVAPFEQADSSSAAFSLISPILLWLTIIFLLDYCEVIQSI